MKGKDSRGRDVYLLRENNIQQPLCTPINSTTASET